MRHALVGLIILCGVGPVQAQLRDATGQTQTIKLIEPVGLERVQTPVEVTVRFAQSGFRDPAAVRLSRVGNGAPAAVASQVLEVTRPPTVDDFAPVPQVFVRLLFLADVPAKGTVEYKVSLDGPAAAPPARLQVTGDGIGRSIDTGTARFELDKPSGQLLALTPTLAGPDRLRFFQFPAHGERPIHWNPDVWATGGRWGHTSDWNSAVAFDPAQHQADAPPAGTESTHPYYFRQWEGPLAYRLSRWGRMPYIPQIETAVTYTFYAGAPLVSVQSLMEARADLPVHTVRNAELVFSRGQFDTAVWIGKDGHLQSAPAWDANQPDRSFQTIARLPPDVPCVGFAHQGKGYGVAYVTQSLTNVNPRTGDAADEGAHLYIRDYDEHGQGSPANFLYFVRPLVYREGYLPTTVSAGSLYAERATIVVFKLKPESGTRYDELLRWHKLLTHPLQVEID